MDVQIGKYKMGDFGLKLLGVDLGTPSVRKSTVTIPGRNGALLRKKYDGAGDQRNSVYFHL